MKRLELLKKQEMTAYQKRALNDMFLRVIEWLEKYVEITYKDEFPDWENRKQIHDNNIERTDIYQYPERVESTLASQLHLFAAFLETDATPKLREEFKQEFYKWINATGIDVNYCPDRLKHFLFGINEVFEKGREKIGKDIENRKREIEMDSPEYMEQIGRMFSDLQVPMREQRKVAKSLEGKKPSEVKVVGFNRGNNKQGEQVFRNIAKSVAGSHQSFHFVEQKGQSISPQQRTNSEIVQDVKKYPRNWRIDEVITEYDKYGKVSKKAEALIYYSTQISYDGAIVDNQQSVYLIQRFNLTEREEISRALNVSLDSVPQQNSSYQETHFSSGGTSLGIHPTNLSEVVQDVKTNPQNWRLDEIPTEIEVDNFNRGIKKKEVVVYYRNARLNDFNPQTGKLNFSDNPIYKWNSFKVQQKFEIKNTLTENEFYLNKTYLTDDEISYVIKEFADNPSVWGIEPIEGHEYLVHSLAKKKNKKEIGTLIHDKGKFSNQELAEINEVLKLNNQYGIVLKKLRNEIPFEFQETHETLEIWAKELEKKLLIYGIRNNVDEWEIREEPFDKGKVIIRKTAQIGDEDYDLTGKLINRSNELYTKDYFNDEELAEINAIFAENDENRKIIEVVKSDINSWKTEKIQGNDWLVNNRAQKIQDEVGHLLHPKQRFTNEEWAEIKNALNNRQSWGSRAISNILPTNFGNRKNYKLEAGVNTSIQPQKDNKINVGIVALISGAVILLGVIIYSLVKPKKLKK